ncbi:glycerophosphodiester phosphodiesterase family protein [Chloroflexota bacterium]
MKTAQEGELKVMVWTVNDRAAIERYLLNANIYGIITNYPDIAVKLKRKQERR